METQSTEQAVIAANDAFYRAFNDKDSSAMDACWARSTTVACVHPGWNALTGRDDVMESWRGILSNPTQPKIVTGGATVTCFRDAAILVCREFVAGTPLVATNAFVLEDGEWRIFHHHSGPVMQAGIG